MRLVANTAANSESSFLVINGVTWHVEQINFFFLYKKDFKGFFEVEDFDLKVAFFEPSTREGYSTSNGWKV